MSLSVTLEEFKKIDLRVAKILDVEEVAGADRIWKLSIDVAGEKKQIVAGIKLAYPDKNSLIGRSIVVVNNLAPATIRGIESNGMLLAAKDASGLCLLSMEKEIASGSLVG